MEASSYNYYEILEAHPHSDQLEISRAYEKMKVTYSFDNPALYTIFNAEEARDLIRLIEEAYSVLGNKTLRSIYDEKIAKSLTQKVDLSVSAIQQQALTMAQEFKPSHSVHIEKPQFVADPEMESAMREQQDWSGEFLRSVREYKQVSVEKMSEITKIGSHYIRAIEDMDVKNLPAVVFVRGYVIQIARTLGLDDKKVADSYMKFYRDSLK